MARKTRARTRRSRSTGSGRRKRPGGGFLQKLLVGTSGVLLVLCAASITWGVFIRHGDDPRDRFRLEVLNGTGEGGLAHRARLGLLRRGIDVIDARNASHFDYKESILVALREGVDLEELGRAIGCKNIIVQIREEPLADAELILGQDYRELRLDWDYRSDLLE